MTNLSLSYTIAYLKISRQNMFAYDSNQLLCYLSDILVYKGLSVQTIITCFSAVERIKLFAKMNKLQKTSAVNIIFTVADLGKNR